MKNTIKIIFISGMKTDSSTGEYSQLKYFMDNLISHMAYYVFLKKTDYFQFKLNNIIFYEHEYELNSYINNINPDIIILSEYQHMSSYFLQYLYSTKKIICTMDSSSLSKKMYNPPENTIFLKNCPLNNPLKNTKNEKYWFFTKGIKPLYDRSYIENKFSLKKGTKNVFISIAPWQYKTSLDLGIDKFYNYVINLLIKTLIAQNKDIALFFICPIKSFHNIVIEEQKVKVLFFESMDNDNYNNILYNSDLVISDNITQVTMVKAFISGINTLSLINTSELNFMKLFKFNIFPYNYDFLPLLYSLEYCQLINKAEVFDEKDMFEKITFLLENKSNNYLDYVERCNNLLSPSEIIEEIILENK